MYSKSQQIKRQPKEKKKNIGIKGAKKKAWDAFSRYIRLRDAIKTTGTIETVECYTCRKIYPAFGVGCVQAGHFIPGRHNDVLLDEVCVRAQCYNCNVNLKGNWIQFERHLVEDYGKDYVEELKQPRPTKIMKVSDWLEEEAHYKDWYNRLLMETL